MTDMLPGMRDYIGREWRDRLDKYARQNRGIYLGFARFIEPVHYSPEEVYRRAAFSILSVQARFDLACQVYNVVIGLTHAQRSDFDVLRVAAAPLLYAPMKATGLLLLAEQVLRDHTFYLLDQAVERDNPSEGWDAYRRRLARGVYGLGKAKGSFLACLLYPLEADLACLDTWVLKRFGFPPENNGHLTWPEYLGAEQQIRRLAQRWDVSTFIAQWIIWDCDRGSLESHSILGMPGAHKDRD